MLSRFCFTTAFVLGIVAYRLPWSTTWPLVALSIGILLWHPRLSGRWALWGLTALALLVGVARAGLDEALAGRAPHGLAGVHTFGGTVLESPRQWGSSLVFFFEVSRIDNLAAPRPLRLLVRLGESEEKVAPGERWEFEGRFSMGKPASYPGGFSQAFWLWTQRAGGVLEVGRFDNVSYLGPPRGWAPRSVAARARQAMLARLERVEDPTARALVAGVVFGDTQALPRDVQHQFRRTGTSHLLAASGMNVALLLGLLTAGARLLGYGPWRIAPALIPVAIGYAFLAGCAPSITRAATAAVMALMAAWLGRTSGSWNSLCLSVWLLLCWEPRQVYDPGFQLSVAAVVGLIGGPSLDESAPTWKKNGVLTLSATLLTLPVMWTTFAELSLTLLPANLVLGPLVELLFPLGLLLTMVPLPPLYWLTEAVARASLLLVARMSALADPLPLAQPGAPSLLLLAVALALWMGNWSRARWFALPLAALALLLGHTLALRPMAGQGELVVRQISDGGKTLFWLSSLQEERLVLSESWQEQRARAMLLSLGCRRPPRIELLSPAGGLELRWGAFQWGNVHPFLPKAPFVEVKTTGSTYSVSIWRPES